SRGLGPRPRPDGTQPDRSALSTPRRGPIPGPALRSIDEGTHLAHTRLPRCPPDRGTDHLDSVPRSRPRPRAHRPVSTRRTGPTPRSSSRRPSPAPAGTDPPRLRDPTRGRELA